MTVYQNTPSQDVPSSPSVYPSPQLHANPPLVLLHTWEQLSMFNKHSLISTHVNNNYNHCSTTADAILCCELNSCQNMFHNHVLPTSLMTVSLNKNTNGIHPIINMYAFVGSISYNIFFNQHPPICCPEILLMYLRKNVSRMFHWTNYDAMYIFW